MTRDNSTRDNASNPEETQRLCEAMCLVKTPEEALAFLADLLSPHEMCDLAQRLEVLCGCVEHHGGIVHHGEPCLKVPARREGRLPACAGAP